MQRQRRNSGFTAVELTVVMFIICALAIAPMLLAGPAFSAGEAGQKAYKTVYAQSPEAAFGVKLYSDCLNTGLFSHNPAPYCRQMVQDIATKQYGTDYGKAALAAVDRMVFMSTAAQ